MTKTEATESAKARSTNGDTVAVVQARLGEVYKGFYPDAGISTLPVEQIISMWRNGKQVA